MKFEVKFADGTIWVDQAANHGAAARRAIAEVYGEEAPDSLTLTISKRGGGAIILPGTKQQ